MTDRMPVIFVGHGSPMNAIEESKYSEGWRAMANELPKPRAILSVSAHWYTDGSKVGDTASPKVIYDMYGFPKPLYEVNYAAPGDPQLARRTMELAGPAVTADNSWGIDHGTWAVLCRMYTAPEIPIVQLSVDKNLAAEQHYELGKKLRPLREEGVLIMASGDVVHNLGLVDWSMDRGFDWADEFDNYIRDNILAGRHGNVIDYKSAGPAAKKAFFTPEHYYPLLYALGASDEKDRVSVWNDSCDLGAVSMTSYMFR